MGLHLWQVGTGDFWWSEFRAYARHAPRDSALAREEAGEAGSYTPTDHLLNESIYWLRVLQWQWAGADGTEPERRFLPGGNPNQDEPDAQMRRGDVMPIEELEKRLGITR